MLLVPIPIAFQTIKTQAITQQMHTHATTLAGTHMDAIIIIKAPKRNPCNPTITKQTENQATTTTTSWAIAVFNIFVCVCIFFTKQPQQQQQKKNPQKIPKKKKQNKKIAGWGVKGQTSTNFCASLNVVKFRINVKTQIKTYYLCFFYFHVMKTSVQTKVRQKQN